MSVGTQFEELCNSNKLATCFIFYLSRLFVRRIMSGKWDLFWWVGDRLTSQIPVLTSQLCIPEVLVVIFLSLNLKGSQNDLKRTDS